jgi:hypothetical protein
MSQPDCDTVGGMEEMRSQSSQRTPVRAGLLRLYYVVRVSCMYLIGYHNSLANCSLTRVVYLKNAAKLLLKLGNSGRG